MKRGWFFWMDQGGTFTDVIARRPDGSYLMRKFLSSTSDYDNPITHALQVLVTDGAPIIGVKVGTTVATNAMLERNGCQTALVTTAGFADGLVIGQQDRPDLFELAIRRPDPIFTDVVEAMERVTAQGDIEIPLDEADLLEKLGQARHKGAESVAVALVNGYMNRQHEQRIAELARGLGFANVVCSTDINQLVKWLPRAQTALIDAYLSPVIDQFVADVVATAGTACWFMTSAGSLAGAAAFRPHKSLFSGPAGGLVGAQSTATHEGLKGFITFDMGGTSTDVAAFENAVEWDLESEIAGFRIQTPTVRMQTIASGGGSVLSFDGERMVVGPQSSGADPGPACYGRGGPASLTDCHVVLGHLAANHFPDTFGPENGAPLDEGAARAALKPFAKAVVVDSDAVAYAAQGFLTIAATQMAHAIKRVTLARGLDARELAMIAFGGAAGQCACMVAEQLGVTRILVPVQASLLSAYGLGSAPLETRVQRTFDVRLSQSGLEQVHQWRSCERPQLLAQLREQGANLDELDECVRVFLKPLGADFTLEVELGPLELMHEQFRCAYGERFGFQPDQRELVIDLVSLELSSAVGMALDFQQGPDAVFEESKRFVYCDDQWIPFRVMGRTRNITDVTQSLIVDRFSTLVVRPGWYANASADGLLTLEWRGRRHRSELSTLQPDPVLLEVFRSGYQSIADIMGTVLQRTALSVNIKERLDYSCALFNRDGALIANAPHMPVHIGSMDMSVRALIEREVNWQEGSSYALNDPYMGGTHVPDVTVVTPVFVAGQLAFFVASRGHHADIGGKVPGSMPSDSRILDEEGIVFRGECIASHSAFNEELVSEILNAGPFPARNPSINIADLKAQVAANWRGKEELRKWVERVGLSQINAYTQHIQDYAESCVRKVLARLADCRFSLLMDNGARLVLDLYHQNGEWVFDFSRSADQTDDNLNAPLAITRAVVLYALRTQIKEAIPLNAGCLAPVRIVVRRGSVLNPFAPAAVAAGNVETSQHLVDLVLGAVKACAASQGTMNNLTFGDAHAQYYETICGGAGGGPGFVGADAVHTHMTNSRMTDPEILEQRFAARVRRFGIRRGSGGSGRFRGGDGAVRELEFLSPMTVSLLMSRRQTVPHGLVGGAAGCPGKNTLVRSNGKRSQLPGCATVAVKPGDRLLIETPGGGGYGSDDGEP